MSEKEHPDAIRLVVFPVEDGWLARAVRGGTCWASTHADQGSAAARAIALLIEDPKPPANTLAETPTR